MSVAFLHRGLSRISHEAALGVAVAMNRVAAEHGLPPRFRLWFLPGDPASRKLVWLSDDGRPFDLPDGTTLDSLPDIDDAIANIAAAHADGAFDA